MLISAILGIDSPATGSRGWRGDVFGVNKQDDLKDNGGTVSGSTTLVIAVLVVEGGKVDMTINQAVSSELENTRLELVFKVDDDHGVLSVAVLPEIWHIPPFESQMLPKTAGFMSCSTVLTPLTRAERSEVQPRRGDVLSFVKWYCLNPEPGPKDWRL